VNETEPNNSTGTANLLAAPATVNGTLSTTSDTDYIRVDLAPGKTLTATLDGGSKDYDLYIYNSVGTQIASSTKAAGIVDSASVTNTGTSTFARYVRVRYYGGGAGSYTLKLSW
jgi:serine protease